MSKSPSNNVNLPIRTANAGQPVEQTRPSSGQPEEIPRAAPSKPSVETLRKAPIAATRHDEPESPSTVTSTSSSSDDDDEDEDSDTGGVSTSKALRNPLQRPRPFKRPSRFGGLMYRSAHQHLKQMSGKDGNDEDENPFLVFQKQPSKEDGSRGDGLSATLRTGQGKHLVGATAAASATSTSSPSSSNPSVAAPRRQMPRPFIASPSSSPEALRSRRGGPGETKSPEQGHSSSSKAATTSAARTTSDGTPSMGSSFSDLDGESRIQPKPHSRANLPKQTQA